MENSLILWDMDGTLVDSSFGITKAINEVRKSKGLHPLSSCEVVKYINDNTMNLAQYFYGTNDYQAEDKVLFENVYETYCLEKLFVYEGVATLLEKLHAEGIAMGVATNASTSFAKKILSHSHLAHYFSSIVGANEVKAPKPSDELLHHAAFSCGKDLTQTRSVMVGDGIKDMISAQKCGATAIHVTWGYSSLNEGYDFQCNSPYELEALLRVNLLE